MSIVSQKVIPQYIDSRFLTLVDLDGNPVHDSEKNIPDIEPDPTPADAWPAWTDLVVCKLGNRDHDLDAGSIRLADAARAVFGRADSGGFDDAFDRWEAENPARDPLVEHFRLVEPEGWREIEADECADTGEWPAVRVDDSLLPANWDAPDSAWIDPRTILPISGGSDEAEPFEPTAQDWQDYAEWSDSLAARRFYAAHPLEEWNLVRPDAIS